MKIESKNDLNVVFFAFRYALGRTTTAPGIVINSIKNNWDDFPTSDKEQFIREIERELSIHIGSTLTSSQKITMDEWDSFKIWIIKNIREEKIDTIID